VLIGIHSELGWCRRVDERIVLLNSERNFVPVTALLETSCDEFVEFLRRTSSVLVDHRQLILDFPFEPLFKHVFHTYPSSYWPELALAWLEVQKSSWPNYRAELAEFSQNKLMPQKSRHRAKGMLRVANIH